MNELSVTSNNTATMTLKEITDLLNVQHSKAMLKVFNMSLQPEFGTLSKMDTVYNDKGQTVETYILDKRQSMAVSAVLNTALLMRVIDRWQELEAKQAPALTQDQQLMALAQGVMRLTEERDHAIKTKALIGSKREATAMAKASHAARRVKKLEAQLQDSGTHISMTAAKLPERVDTEVRDNVQAWRLLKSISTDMGLEVVKVNCPRYGEVNTYHIDVINRFKDMYLPF